MTETLANRRWVISNRMGEAVADLPGRQESVDTLLYYQAQLKAELEEVRRRIAEVTRGG